MQQRIAHGDLNHNNEMTEIKQVSVAWKTMCQWMAGIISVLVVVIIGGGAWFGTTVWGKIQEHDRAVAMIDRLSDRLDQNTKALDRLTTRFDEASAKHEK